MRKREEVRFDRFTLDLADRRLRRDGEAVELNARYFDALVLLVRESGALVTKDRFLEEVWRGVPVTDEALTQGIKTLRRTLGDDAAQPRFIETVPKHGYRFIATIDHAPPAAGVSGPGLSKDLLLSLAGIVGGGLAGLAGGVAYGFAGVVQPPQPGAGAISVLLVLLSLTTLVAIVGAAGVSVGIAAASALAGRSALAMAGGGALGGLFVGALVKLLGLDAFTLLFGQSPGQITGGMEGMLVGGAVGLAGWWSLRSSARQGMAVAAMAGALAGWRLRCSAAG
ncbi:winged helix-turn-helix domain-containing protein [Sphingomonas rhizophila]|uniref:winged helix-turn-helix domain-containing protein n=1 Tax=Sphingomonas rhizophila TaxID=2071607 RepID=UPI001FE4D7A4|nr:winged helix-turn-helix domain-containing protein [Sphingomonas rhizophila]